MKKSFYAVIMTAALMITGITACGTSKSANGAAASIAGDGIETASRENDEKNDSQEKKGEAAMNTTIYVDIAASMTSSFEEITALYKEKKPEVQVVINSGSSGTLLKQIEESDGIGHDIFFSAGKKQVKTLDETDGLVVEGSVTELLRNSLCLVTGTASGTKVTGWENMADAGNMALCDGTVPVGKYSREAFVSLGILDSSDDNSKYTSTEVSEALGGIEINETADVAAAAQAVAEGSNEIGTVYYTDWYDWKDDLVILAQDDEGELTGPIIYPVCQVKNSEASEAELAAAEDFMAFLQSDEVLKIFEDHCFIINR